MTTMNITIEKLHGLQACSEAVAWLRVAFPNGTELTAESLASCPHADWVCWLAGKLSQDYRFWCAGVAFREAAQVNPSLRPWAMNVTAENWREARSAAAYADTYAAAYAAATTGRCYPAAAYAANAAYAAAAYAADAARKEAWKELRTEAERVLLNLA